MSQAKQTVERICFKTPKEDFLYHFFRHLTFTLSIVRRRKKEKKMSFPFESKLKRKLISLDVWTKLS